ncbi:hypothetical protein V3C99_008787, partial [Haemonchus contortus]
CRCGATRGEPNRVRYRYRRRKPTRRVAVPQHGGQVVPQHGGQADPPSHVDIFRKAL